MPAHMVIAESYGRVVDAVSCGLGTIVSPAVSSTGLLKVVLDSGGMVARHVDRLTPVDEEARALIASWKP